MTAELMQDYVDSSVTYIRNDLVDLKRGFIRLGFHLREMYICQYYLQVPRLDGNGMYDDFYDLCQEYFDLSRSTVSRLMDINIRFCDRKIFIDQRYADYSYSQLCEMVSIKSDTVLYKIRPTMTVKEIREIKKSASNSCLCDVAKTDRVKRKGLTSYQILSLIELIDQAKGWFQDDQNYMCTKAAVLQDLREALTKML